ncbi:glycosyltransferase family 2 protein [Candidatus Curtissbacteria bacterium]|nr:glycosyltransferase family 2 protein [Candidatus Curtissbacteria bacterium]
MNKVNIKVRRALSIIIPSFNEGKTLKEIVNKVLSFKTIYNKEVIIVDDGSTDETRQILKRFPSSKNIKVIVNSKNLGKGASVTRALKIATGDIVVIQDADLEYDPRDIPKILALFDNKNVKVVYGSRILGNNPSSHWTFNLGGQLVTLVTNILFRTNITDEPTGYKAMRRDVLKNLKLKSQGFEFCPEITAKIAKQKIKIWEVPISYHPRPVKEKKIKWQDGVAAIFYLLKYRITD